VQAPAAQRPPAAAVAPPPQAQHEPRMTRPEAPHADEKREEKAEKQR
jgi:hypothetical protein